jgi:DNA-binding LacI/PurR family transcriptional regulator
MGFVHGVLEAGLSVPDDVAVVGFDDIPLAEYLKVPLTTVAYPKYDAGELAAQRLVELMEDAEHMERPERVLLEPQLIVRESSGGRE